jgi:NusA-like KH domain protein
MVKILFTQEILGMMAVFQNVTHVTAKDCFQDTLGVLTFVVPSFHLGKSIGKNALHVKRLEQLFTRKIRILGYDENLCQFVQNIVYPLKIMSIEENQGILTLKDPKKKTKSLLIGRNAQNLRNTESIVKRYFSHITEIKVI